MVMWLINSFTNLDFADDMESLDKQFWRLQISTAVKLKPYNMCVLLILLYGSECWVITKVDACKIFWH